MTDKQRLDFMESNQWRGHCILNDDNDHWAIIDCFCIRIHSHDLKVTKVTDREHGEDTTMEFHIKKQEWKNSLRGVIDSYIEKCHEIDCDDGRAG